MARVRREPHAGSVRGSIRNRKLQNKANFLSEINDRRSKKANFKANLSQFSRPKPTSKGAKSHRAARENLAAAPRAVNGHRRAPDASSGLSTHGGRFSCSRSTT